MKLSAEGRENTGKVLNAVGMIKDGKVVAAQPVPRIVRVEIVETPNAYLLFMYDETDSCVADGWFETLKEAKANVYHQFMIEETDWHIGNEAD